MNATNLPQAQPQKTASATPAPATPPAVPASRAERFLTISAYIILRVFSLAAAIVFLWMYFLGAGMYLFLNRWSLDNIVYFFPVFAFMQFCITFLMLCFAPLRCFQTSFWGCVMNCLLFSPVPWLVLFTILGHHPSLAVLVFFLLFSAIGSSIKSTTASEKWPFWFKLPVVLSIWSYLVFMLSWKMG